MSRYKGKKGKAWKVFSEYIRKRDGGVCVTCGKTSDAGFIMQAGHYQPMGYVGSNNKLSWDEYNVHCQCKHCNYQGQGQQELMARYIESKYGEEKLNEIKGRTTKVDPVEDWDILIEYYHNKLKKL